MASERKQSKSESLIIRYVSEIIRSEVKNDKIGLVSLLGCKISADLSNAKIFVTFLNSTDPTLNLAALNEAKGFIRSRLANRLDLRKVPNLLFILDDTMEKSDNLESILKNIQK